MPRLPRRDSDGRSHHRKGPIVILKPDAPKLTSPKLPDIGRKWHASTVAWWSDSVTGVWASPMADEIVNADIHGLYRLALLLDDFAIAETPRERAQLAAEIRLSSAAYGLDPTSRRKLGWRIASEAKRPENHVQKYLRKPEKDARDYWLTAQ